jgi:copper transporter 1
MCYCRRVLIDRHHVVQTLAHLAQFWVSYCMMLVFMTYNIWLCLALALGSTTGYFLLGWRRHHLTLVPSGAGECCP